MVTLPNLIGKTLEEASSELARRKLSVVQTVAQFDTQWERGKIISQEPSPGSKIKINRVVKVTLSAGTEKVLVPRLIGRNFQNSNQILKEARLKRVKFLKYTPPSMRREKSFLNIPRLRQKLGATPLSVFLSVKEKRKKSILCQI